MDVEVNNVAYITLKTLYPLSQSMRTARHVAVPLQQAEQDDWGGDDVRCHGIHAAAAGAVDSIAVSCML
jgi:hypothetical protein